MNNYIEPKQEIKVAVDAVCIARESDKRYILLIKREYEPFKDRWALPGGFLRTDEELEKGVLRELKEETNVDIQDLFPIQAGVFGKKGRDPRRRVISIAFLIKFESKRNISASNESLEVKWVNIEDLNSSNLAFDHKDIIEGALKYLD